MKRWILFLCVLAGVARAQWPTVYMSNLVVYGMIRLGDTETNAWPYTLIDTNVTAYTDRDNVFEGSVEAQSFTGNAPGLTNLQASSFAAGGVFPALDGSGLTNLSVLTVSSLISLSNDVAGWTASSNVVAYTDRDVDFSGSVTANLFTGDGSGLTNLTAGGGSGSGFPLTNDVDVAGYTMSNGTFSGKHIGDAASLTNYPESDPVWLSSLVSGFESPSVISAAQFHSVSGGFLFPDGTTQMTAGVSGSTDVFSTNINLTWKPTADVTYGNEVVGIRAATLQTARFKLIDTNAATTLYFDTPPVWTVYKGFPVARTNTLQAWAINFLCSHPATDVVAAASTSIPVNDPERWMSNDYVYIYSKMNRGATNMYAQCYDIIDGHLQIDTPLSFELSTNDFISRVVEISSISWSDLGGSGNMYWTMVYTNADITVEYGIDYEFVR